MAVNSQIDRRSKKARSFRFNRSWFLELPPEMAALAVIAVTALTVTVDLAVHYDIWYGPIYLLIAACAGWFVGRRFAISLGLAVLSIKWFSGIDSTYPYGSNSIHLNFTLKAACVLSVALMLGLARKSLEREWRLARIDPLTGALNRQAFFEAIKSGAGQKEPAVLAFADVDGLKRLNDLKGHERGDDGLRDFANRMKGMIRRNDLFARIGGDEFVLFMKVKDEKAAKTVIDRLNKALNIELEMNEAALKCSFGVLFLPKGSLSIDAELKLADKLMYSAKRVQAGFLMATATQPSDHEYLPSALETALPANFKSIIRQTSGKVTVSPRRDFASGKCSHGESSEICDESVEHAAVISAK